MKALHPARWFFRKAVHSPRWFACWLGLLRMLFALKTSGAIPARRPLLFAGNHGSYYDGWFLLAIVREAIGEWPVMLAWRGMRRYFVTRQLLRARALRMILAPETPSTSESRASICWRMVEALQQGRSLCLHAEGDVLAQLGKFQPGAAFAAWEAGVPIVPFTLRGVQPLWKKLPCPHRFWGSVSIEFHSAVDPADYRHLAPRAAIAAMTEEVRRRVASTIDYPDGCAAAAPV